MNEPVSPTNTPPPAPPADPPVPAPGPAAVTVIEGQKTERELDLEKKLADAEAARIKVEKDASYLQDENHRLKQAQSGPAPVSEPKRKRAFVTLLHDPED